MLRGAQESFRARTERGASQAIIQGSSLSHTRSEAWIQQYQLSFLMHIILGRVFFLSVQSPHFFPFSQ